MSVEAEFRVGREDHRVDFRADRYRIDGEQADLTPWSTPLGEHARVDGVAVPSRRRATWTRDGEPESLRVGGIRYL